MSMKMTGIVRRMDDLGRVVIPKEVTRATCAHEQQAYKISVQGTDILLKKEDTTDRHNLVRTVDDLRRLAIPRTIRRELGLNEGQPLEILHDFDSILLRPFEILSEPVAVKEEEVKVEPSMKVTYGGKRIDHSMKTTQIGRKIDDLGRIYLPKEVREATGASEHQEYEVIPVGNDLLLRIPESEANNKVVRALEDYGRFPLPRTVREKLNIQEGDWYEILHNDQDILLRLYATSEVGTIEI